MHILKKTAALLLALTLVLSVLPAAQAAQTGGSQDLGIFSSDLSGLNSGVDNSDLKLTLARVSGLNRYRYTQASWDALQKVYEEAKAAQEATSQDTIDAAREKLEKAIASLVEMDYKALEGAMDQVEALIGENPQLHDVWLRLYDAVEEYKPLLTSGDQKAVNEAAQELQALLEELALYADPDDEPEVVVQEVQVEVPPTDDFCNISLHRTWPVLFFISLALNVALAGLLVYILVRRKNTTDDMPLVDYDIDDDILDDDLF